MHSIHQKVQLIAAALFGVLSIALAAVGSHAFLAELSENNLLSAFQKGVDYAMYHAIALLALVGFCQVFPAQRYYWVGYAWVIGTLLFSGGLFLHALLQWHAVVFIVPIGGTMLILGWSLLLLFALLQPLKQ